jgi:plasmid stability protein
MTTLTIHDVDDDIAQRLHTRAALHGRTVEAEARAILAYAVNDELLTRAPDNIADAIRSIMTPIGGVDLPPFPDDPAPEPLRFR